MQAQKGISYRVSEEFSRIYITGSGTALRKIYQQIGREMCHPYTLSWEDEELFRAITKYQKGKMTEFKLEEVLGPGGARQTTFGTHRIYIEIDSQGKFVPSGSVLMKYLYNGSADNFSEIKKTFEKALAHI